MNNDETIRRGAIAWLLTAEFFIGQAVAQLAWPAYWMADNDISLLGATYCGADNPAPHGIAYVCSPLNVLFDASLALLGILIIAGAVLTRKAWPKRRTVSIALPMILAGGLGGIMAGLFPYNFNIAVHTTGALLNFLVGNIGIFLLGAVLVRRHPVFAIYSMLTALACLTGLVLYGSGMEFGVGRGILERLAAYPQNVWFIVTGALLALRPRRFDVDPNAS